jgi:NAD dependent epimerase/dehydratase family enzyme
MLRFALDHSELEGPLNVAAPQPARNRQVAAAIGRVLERPSWVRVPGLALQLALGELSSVILTGQRVVPAVAQRLDYAFQQPALLPAVRAALLTS